MAEVSEKWAEVGRQLETLARKLRTHFEQAGSAEAVAEPLQKLKVAVTEAFESAGNAVRDEAVRSDAREVGRLFFDAVSATFAKAAETLREKASGGPPPADNPPADPPRPIDTKPAE